MRNFSFLSLVLGAVLVCATATPTFAEKKNGNSPVERAEDDRKENRDGRGNTAKPGDRYDRDVPDFVKDLLERRPVERAWDNRKKVRSDESNVARSASVSGRVHQDWGDWRNSRGR